MRVFGISGAGVKKGVRCKEPDGVGVDDDWFGKVLGIDRIGPGRRGGRGEIRGGCLDRSEEDRPCLGRDYQRDATQTGVGALWSISSRARRGNRPNLRVQSKAASYQHIELGSFLGPKVSHRCVILRNPYIYLHHQNAFRIVFASFVGRDLQLATRLDQQLYLDRRPPSRSLFPSRFDPHSQCTQVCLLRDRSFLLLNLFLLFFLFLQLFLLLFQPRWFHLLYLDTLLHLPHLKPNNLLSTLRTFFTQVDLQRIRAPRRDSRLSPDAPNPLPT